MDTRLLPLLFLLCFFLFPFFLFSRLRVIKEDLIRKPKLHRFFRIHPRFVGHEIGNAAVG